MSKKDRAKKRSSRAKAEKARKEIQDIIKRLKEKEPIASKQNRFQEISLK